MSGSLLLLDYQECYQLKVIQSLDIVSQSRRFTHAEKTVNVFSFLYMNDAFNGTLQQAAFPSFFSQEGPLVYRNLLLLVLKRKVNVFSSQWLMKKIHFYSSVNKENIEASTNVKIFFMRKRIVSFRS